MPTTSHRPKDQYGGASRPTLTFVAGVDADKRFSTTSLYIQLESIYFNPPLNDFNFFLVKTGNTDYDKRTISKRKYLTFKSFEVQGHLYEHKIKSLWPNHST